MKGGAWGEFTALPNLVSFARILATPIFIILFLNEPGKKQGLIACAVFLLVCLTDWLDGFLARRMRLVTTIGKFIDPLADKILIISVMIILIPLGRIPAWMVALIVSREIAITGLRAVAASASKTIIDASIAGKIKTVTQITALACLILHYKFYGIDFQRIGIIVFWVALIATIYSGIEYFVRFYSSFDKRDVPPGN